MDVSYAPYDYVADYGSNLTFEELWQTVVVNDPALFCLINFTIVHPYPSTSEYPLI
jgi:hypothetical protein